jgi:hypothetical protein
LGRDAFPTRRPSQNSTPARGRRGTFLDENAGALALELATMRRGSPQHGGKQQTQTAGAGEHPERGTPE